LGARLAMQEWLKPASSSAETASRNGEAASPAEVLPPSARQQVLDLLHESLRGNPHHPGALWCLAAVGALLGRPEILVAQAAAMARILEHLGGTDARFDFLAAVCQLTARDYPHAIASARSAAEKDAALTAEAAFLKGWAHLRLDDPDSAIRALSQPARDSQSPAQPSAQALLGKIHFARGDHAEAISWWKALDPARRREWNLEEPFRGALLLTALEALGENRFQAAAAKLHEAEKLGGGDKRLRPLLTLALMKAGQQLLYSP
jgi:tetratricopeptide (TPR) repeat protein